MTKSLFGALLTFTALLTVAGCGTPEDAQPKDDKKPGEHAHDHPTEGPHGGHLIELGQEEYHAELVHDDATKAVTIYLLDSTAAKPVGSSDATVTLNLIVDGKVQQAILDAAPQPGDTAGQSSRFTIVDEQLLESLEGAETTGRLNVTIDDKSYAGTISHDGHDH